MMTDKDSIMNIPEHIYKIKKLLVKIEIEAKIAPMLKEPVSPIKIFAGYLLKLRNPKHKPDIE